MLVAHNGKFFVAHEGTEIVPVNQKTKFYTKPSPESLLFDACRSNEFEEVKELLSSSPNINIFYNDGKFFDFALSHKSLPMLEALLRHCEVNSPQETNERMMFEYRLKSILSHALETHNVSQEIEDRISPYLANFDQDTDDEQDIDFDSQEAVSFFDQDDMYGIHVQQEDHLESHLNTVGNNSHEFE
jgi:hypothetical protein